MGKGVGQGDWGYFLSTLCRSRPFLQETLLTILPDVENLIESAILHRPVANQLRVSGPQVDLLISQLEEGSILLRTNVVCTELVQCSMFLLGTR